MKPVKNLLLVVAACCGLNSTFAQTWTQNSAPSTNWVAVACSADGSKLVAAATGGVGINYVVLPGPIYISTNSGVDWTQSTNAPAAAWCSVASSADGTQLIAAVGGGGIYRSADSGLTWNQTTASNLNWRSVASSADGSKLAALAAIYPPPNFYTSSDSGETWTPKASPYSRWGTLASSADGNTLVAAGDGIVLASTDSGNSWTTNFLGEQRFATTSADGSRLLVTGNNTYLSTNSGLIWNQINTPSFDRIASSADGSRLVAVGGSIFYVSTNYGTTWTTNVFLGYSSVASSADGSKLVDVVNGGGIWTAETTPAPQMNLAFPGGNLAFSWILPSTNFVLQQSQDLSSWTDLTNTPALNLTNLQNEVTLPMTNNIGFYRLSTP